ncbi:protein Churchill isoform 2-T2 [Spheniscus humboldti]
MCGGCVGTGYPERGTTCLEGGSFLLNFVGPVQELPPPDRAPRVHLQRSGRLPGVHHAVPALRPGRGLHQHPARRPPPDDPPLLKPPGCGGCLTPDAPTRPAAAQPCPLPCGSDPGCRDGVEHHGPSPPCAEDMKGAQRVVTPKRGSKGCPPRPASGAHVCGGNKCEVLQLGGAGGSALGVGFTPPDSP